MILNTHEFAWAAGFFDGEGHVQAKFGTRKSDPIRRVYRTMGIEIPQKNPCLLYRFRDIFNVGYVLGPYRNNKNQDHFSYRYWVARFEHIQFVMSCMWNWLGPIKRKQYADAVTLIMSQPRLYCGVKPSSGIKGVYKNGDRWCARLNCNGNRVHLGSFRTVNDAAAQIERFRKGTVYP